MRVGLTLARRVCSFCGGSQGFRLWQWSGRAFVTTHTVCPRCVESHGLLRTPGPHDAQPA